MSFAVTGQMGGAPSHLRKVRVPKTAELVVQRFRREIIFGNLREGDPLPSESELTEQFGVSRPTLREAFRILESEGLISIARGAKGGARVHGPTDEVAARYTGWVMQFRQTSLAEIYAARVVLEAPCAGVAAERRTRKDLDRLRNAIGTSAEATGDGALRSRRHLEFRAVVIDVAENRALQLLIGMMDVILERADQQYFEDSKNIQAIEKRWGREQQERVQLVELIEQRDSVAAELLWREHLEESSKQVLQTVGSKNVIDFME